MVQRVVVPYHPPSGEPVGICRPSVAWPQKVQPFVVPHFSQTPPNHRPENLRSRELPTETLGPQTGLKKRIPLVGDVSLVVHSRIYGTEGNKKSSLILFRVFGFVGALGVFLQ